MKKKIKILVATHKTYNFPEGTMYQPIQVGKTIGLNDFGYLGDDTGDNISDKNRSFNELTALYWAWKNEFFKDSDFCGLVHYRRYFSGQDTAINGKRVLGPDGAEKLMADSDVVVPKKRNYFVETIKSHYIHAHYEKDFNHIRELILEQSPSYIDAFDRVMGQRSLHLYNMFIMRPELFTAYCEWLFPLLFELEKRVDISSYDDYQKRIFGFLAERLFNVWLLKNNLKVKELKVVNIEGENLLLKGLNMLKRKIVGK